MKTPSQRLGDVLREFQELIFDTQSMFPSRQYPAFTEALTHYQRTLPRNRLEERKRLGLPPLPPTGHQYSQNPGAVAARAYRQQHGAQQRFVSVEDLVAAQGNAAPEPDQALIDRLAREAEQERIAMEQGTVQPLKEGESLV